TRTEEGADNWYTKLYRLSEARITAPNPTITDLQQLRDILQFGLGDEALDVTKGLSSTQAIECANHMRKHSDGISLHKFPNESNTRRQWIRFVQVCRADFGPAYGTPNNNSMICERNFTSDAYDLPYQLKQSLGIECKGKRLLEDGNVNDVKTPIKENPRITEDEIKDTLNLSSGSLDRILRCHLWPDGTERNHGAQTVKRMALDFLGKGHTIYMDSFFSKPDLFEWLRERDTMAVGTVLKGREGLPASLHPNTVKLKKGESMFRRKDNLLCYRFKDKKTTEGRLQFGLGDEALDVTKGLSSTQAIECANHTSETRAGEGADNWYTKLYRLSEARITASNPTTTDLQQLRDILQFGLGAEALDVTKGLSSTQAI
ncbi:hypothetical protein BaRGS_00035138, partial [Batillaria attramentaria]